MGSPAGGDDEALIIADHAHRGERAVALLRLLTWCALGFASAGVGGATNEPRETSTARALVIFGWLVFGVIVLIALRRSKFTPLGARLWPLLFMAVDFSVLTFVNLHSARAVRPEVATSVLAIILAYSVARFSGLLVWISCAMACVSALSQAWFHGWFNARGVAMVVSSYVALSAMIHWGNRELRRMFVDVRRRERLSRFLPAQVVSRILSEGSAALEPTQREVTILFSDLRDFTSLSQRMDPGQVLALLDDYFARMTSVVQAHGGMVNKFIGDGMLAVWGVPDAQPDHALRAVHAALAMRTELEALNRLRAARGEVALRIGVGLHTGTVAAGMLGGARQAEYTVLGDAVNLASRIEGLTKKPGADVVISDATLRQCGGALATERAGEEQVKGRDETVVVHRVLGAAG